MWTMGLAARPVRRRGQDGPWTPRGGAWMAFTSTSHPTTHVAQTNTEIDHLSTNGASYPQVRTPYPHLAHRGSRPPYPPTDARFQRPSRPPSNRGGWPPHPLTDAITKNRCRASREGPRH